jgi:hypothetical protein
MVVELTMMIDKSIAIAPIELSLLIQLHEYLLHPTTMLYYHKFIPNTITIQPHGDDERLFVKFNLIKHSFTTSRREARRSSNERLELFTN